MFIITDKKKMVQTKVPSFVKKRLEILKTEGWEVQ